MQNYTEVRIFKKPKRVYDAIAKEILKLTRNSNQEIINIALSGGNSPKGLFNRLSDKYSDKIAWERIHFWWGDERCVSPDDEESNYKMTKISLFSNIAIPEKNIHRIHGEANPEEEAIRYSQEIEKNIKFRGQNPVFDIVILGLGEDGHTASIFPDQLELIDSNKNCAVTKHPLSSQKRITLTGKAINNANQIYFLVIGTSKAMRISEIMNDNEAAKLLPAYYISPINGRLIWFIDEEAAAQIS